MSKTSRRGRATVGVATIFRMVAYTLALAAFVPAFMVNIDWSGATGWHWSVAAGFSILFSAVFFLAARHSDTPRSLIAAGWFLILVNTVTAFSNASHHSDHLSDHRKAAMVSAEKASSQWSQWSQARKAQVDIAGERPSAAYEADIQAVITGNSRRWQSTSECNPRDITSAQSREFCSSVSELRSKLAAAKKREELEARMASLDATPAVTDKPTAADPFVGAATAIVGLLGGSIETDQGQRAVAAIRDLIRSVGAEMVAAIGPAAWIVTVNAVASFLSLLSSSASHIGTRVAAKSAPQAVGEPKTTEAAPEPSLSLADPFHKFVAERLEDCSGASMKAGEPWALWQRWCAENNEPTGTQKAFGGKMTSMFAKETSGNRPRYLNVRAKPAAPSLRVVSTNP